MSNIPNYEQWGKLNDYLDNIAMSLGDTVDVSTWSGVQKAVRIGVAPQLLPVGTQLQVEHSTYGTITFDVVAHDYLKPARNKNAHTMTLLSSTVLHSGSYSAPQAFYYAESELSAGTYSVTLASNYSMSMAGTYNFTLTKAVPKGGQLAFVASPSVGMTNATVGSYGSPHVNTPTETVSVKTGSSGTSLGTFGVELNSIERCVHGSDEYRESAVRQFLNSNWVDEVWTHQSKYDRRPSWLATVSGFMYGMETEFLNTVGEVEVPCATTDGKYTVTDKFYLPSHQEVLGTNYSAVQDDSILLPYYKGATSVDRIKAGASSVWWTRTSSAMTKSAVYYVGTTGVGSYGYSTTTNGIVPMCTIV